MLCVVLNVWFRVCLLQNVSPEVGGVSDLEEALSEVKRVAGDINTTVAQVGEETKKTTIK